MFPEWGRPSCMRPCWPFVISSGHVAEHFSVLMAECESFGGERRRNVSLIFWAYTFDHTVCGRIPRH